MNTKEDLTTRLGKIKKEIINGRRKNALLSYTVDTNDFANLWYKMHHDLGYPLKIDSRYKRAIVMNKQGLEKKIEKMITEVMEANFDKLVEMATKEIENQLNSVTQTINGTIVIGKGGSHKSTATLLANATAKGLIKGIFNIIDDITRYDDSNKRR